VGRRQNLQYILDVLPLIDKDQTEMTNHAASRQRSSAETLIDLLEAVAITTEAGVTLYPPSSSQSLSVGAQQKALRLSHGELLSSAEEKAYLLLQNFPVLTERKVVLIHLDHHVDSIPWFWAVVYAGLLPALLPPLSSNPRQREQNLQHLTALLDNPLILTTENLLKRFPELQQPGTYTIESLQSHTNGANDAATTNGEFIARFLPPRGDEPCVLMLTSGSTGNSKAVSLTVPQILASV
jgi:acyl-CoA synthetase (AMP-forming)/AMP-acid ligase II